MSRNPFINLKDFYLEIKPNYFCNDDCFFCDFQDKKRLKAMTFQEIKTNIDYFYNNYQIREIVFSGGEPTVRSDFIDVLIHIKTLEIPTLYLHTNAIMFSNLDFANRSLKYVSKVLVGFHAHNSKLYNTISTLNNFKKKILGIRNILECGLPLRTNTVINRLNLRFLPNIAKVLSNIGVKRALLTFPFIIGRTKSNFKRVIPTDLDLVKIYLEKAIKIFQDNQIITTLQGFSPCVTKGYLDLKEIWNERILIDVEHQLENYLLLFNDAIAPFLYCRYCKLNYQCTDKEERSGYD